MARRVFHTFHYKRDSKRVSQIRNMGVIEGQRVLNSNEWEAVKRGGDPAIERWIAEQMQGKSCVVVLIGAATAGRRWVKHEIKKAWGDKRGLVGVHIHGLAPLNESQDSKGRNPFEDFNVNGTPMDSIVPVYDPPYRDSKGVYSHIRTNLADWVEEGIATRNRYG